jgi:hypothetical protein
MAATGNRARFWNDTVWPSNDDGIKQLPSPELRGADPLRRTVRPLTS